ncbi:MAG: YbaB/EbfC family nucleoid-associated protein [Chloroflexi bacterium]|nr:YbaB/EbfC family nucleoid-associated protein [Chloroflexota bacterium]
MARKGLFGGLGGLDPISILKQLQAQIDQAQKEIAESQVEGSAGGGAVRVIMRGDHRVVAVQINPELLQEGDVEMLQDLLVTAFNNAVAEVERLTKEKMEPIQKTLGGFNLPI